MKYTLCLLALLLLGSLSNQTTIPDRLHNAATQLNTIADNPQSSAIRLVATDLVAIADDVDNPPPPPANPPEIAVSENDVNIPDGTAIDYGLTVIEKTFTVLNAGGQDLTFEAFVVPAGFAVEPATLATLAPGNSETFVLTLTATEAGIYSGEVSFANNDGDENPYNFAVSGEVAQPPSAMPVVTLTVEPTEIEQGQSATLTWTTANADSATLDEEVVDLQGTQTVSPAAGTHSYTLIAVGPGGSASADASLEVTEPPPPPPQYDTSHDPGDLMGVPDFGSNPTLYTIDGAGPEDIVRIGHADSASICEPLTVKVLAVHGHVEICGDLHVQTLLVYHDGELTLKPPAHITIRDLPIDATLDPAQWGNGIIVQGKIRCEDFVPKTVHCEVENIAKNATSVTVHGTIPADWAVGDEIVLPRQKQQNDTYYKSKPNAFKFYPTWHGESERNTIASISGNVIGLATPAKWDHAGANDYQNQQVVWCKIANESRQITVESANPTGVRGHFVCMGMADVWLRGIRTKNLGRTTIGNLDNWDGNGHVGTNQIGRYNGIHIHHCVGPMGGIVDAPYRDRSGEPYQYIIENCSITCGEDEHPQKWGITLHRSSWGLVLNNVVDNVAGSAITEEDGVERNNEIIGNYLCDMNARTRFINPATGLLWGPELLEPGVNDQLRRADSRGTGAFGIWWLRGLDLYCKDNIIYDLNPGNQDQGWDPDQRPTFYWRGLTPLSNLAPTHRGESQATWVPFAQCGAPQLVVVDGGVSAAADQTAEVIRSAVLGDASHAETHVIRNHVNYNMALAWSAYQNTLIADDNVFYSDPQRLWDGGAGIDASQGTGSIFRNCRVENCWVGLENRAGRGYADFTIENFTSVCLHDVYTEPSPISQDHVTLVIHGLTTLDSTVLYNKPITGYTGNAQPAKAYYFNFESKDYDSGRYLDEMKNFNPVIFRVENWNGHSYSMFAKTFGDPAWKFPKPTSTYPMPHLKAVGILTPGPDGVWGNADDVQLTAGQASALGYTMWGRLAPAGSVVLPKTRGTLFFEE